MIQARGEDKDSQQRYQTPAEFAVEARVGIETVWRWIRQGKVPAVRLGRCWRIPIDKAEQVLTGGFSLN